MSKVPESILQNVGRVIDTYNIFGGSKDVVVAYSGGKDSFFLCLVLKELGFNIQPVIIDIGFNLEWDLAKKNAERLGLNPVVLNLECLKNISCDAHESVCHYFGIFEKVSNNKNKLTSLCTPCYNAKITAIKSWATHSNTKVIAFGHHSTDCISSLLKSYYLYSDRWDNSNSVFNIQNIIDLIDEFKVKIHDEKFKSKMFSGIEGLISHKYVGTDEPIRQTIDDSDIQIVRPLFFVFENAIREYYSHTDFKFPSIECRDFRTEKAFTCREFVQCSLSGLDSEMMDALQKFTLLSLNSDGSLAYNVRNRRNEILGDLYKSENICDKKL